MPLYHDLHHDFSCKHNSKSPNNNNTIQHPTNQKKKKRMKLQPDSSRIDQKSKSTQAPLAWTRSWYGLKSVSRSLKLWADGLLSRSLWPARYSCLANSWTSFMKSADKSATEKCPRLQKQKAWFSRQMKQLYKITQFLQTNKQKKTKENPLPLSQYCTKSE